MNDSNNHLYLLSILLLLLLFIFVNIIENNTKIVGALVLFLIIFKTIHATTMLNYCKVGTVVAQTNVEIHSFARDSTKRKKFNV
jgi:membrane-bound acyltransferase YfiQ involved in biofilm formation